MTDSEREPSAEEHFEFILALLDDEELQNSSVHEMMAMQMALGADSNSGLVLDSTFGWQPENPIPVNGPMGERTYLSRLRTDAGVPFFFHRLGSTHGTIDVFEIVSFDQKVSGTLYVDMYHLERCRSAPEGLELENGPAPFTGMTSPVDDFPVGLIDAISGYRGTPLGDCYLPDEFLQGALQFGGWVK
jgi:hypothetical protein